MVDQFETPLGIPLAVVGFRPCLAAGSVKIATNDASFLKRNEVLKGALFEILDQGLVVDRVDFSDRSEGGAPTAYPIRVSGPFRTSRAPESCGGYAAWAPLQVIPVV
jgi:hypothetical protein